MSDSRATVRDYNIVAATASLLAATGVDIKRRALVEQMLNMTILDFIAVYGPKGVVFGKAIDAEPEKVENIGDSDDEEEDEDEVKWVIRSVASGTYYTGSITDGDRDIAQWSRDCSQAKVFSTEKRAGARITAALMLGVEVVRLDKVRNEAEGDKIEPQVKKTSPSFVICCLARGRNPQKRGPMYFTSQIAGMPWTRDINNAFRYDAEDTAAQVIDAIGSIRRLAVNSYYPPKVKEIKSDE